jgi:site-specific DNA recombinase
VKLLCYLHTQTDMAKSTNPRRTAQKRLPLALERDPRCAVLYARVSSKEQELGYSIRAQQELRRSYAAKRGMLIQQEFLEVETAKTTGRPVFAEMLNYLEHHPRCGVLLVEKTDRLYRNLRDSIMIEELQLDVLLVKESDIQGRETRSASKFMHGIRVLMAKNFIENLREEVQKGLRTKAAQGPFPSYAPIGYQNVVDRDGKRIIVPDPVLGPQITALFAWFACGEYSLKTLAQKAYREGIRFWLTQTQADNHFAHSGYAVHSRVFAITASSSVPIEANAIEGILISQVES